ncbi:MAG: hypothetical protein BGO68_02745 [Candidatus Amoebophilus sp. 36-38]|nr:MAG: hypothetical protein BGO68_02745 [Candidatus Amoebophilus sp. 36-38]
MGKALVVDLPVLLAKLGVKGVESLVKWEDKLGIKEGCANLGEICKILFNEGKQAWEDPIAYEARMQAVRELEKKQELFRFVFDAENYYLGQDRILSYMMAEMVLFLFGGEILKGAAKGASKGAQFFRKVQQGVKVEERVVRGSKLGKGANIVKFKLNNKNTFKGAYPSEIKEFLQIKGWKIESLKKGKLGFKATNPTNKSDVIKVIEVNASKLKDSTNIIGVKRGTYLKRGYEKWERIPLKNNPTLQ